MINPFASETELLILKLLQENPLSYGLQLVEKSNGKLKRGTVYVTLGRLEERGLVKAKAGKKASHRGPPRPQYLNTRAGERVLDAWDILRSVKC